MSRSASIVIAYLMWKEHIKFKEAFDFVKEKRHSIEPNGGFIMQLKYFESLLNENNYDLRKINFKKLDFRELWKKFG
jgi:protein-tyrosine phosphatase